MKIALLVAACTVVIVISFVEKKLHAESILFLLEIAYGVLKDKEES